MIAHPLNEDRIDAIADIVRLTPQPALLRMLDGEILSANELMHEALHLQPGELRGQNIFDLLPRHAADRHRASDEQQIASAQVVSMEWSMDLDGESIRVYTFKYPVLDKSGRVVAILALSSRIEGRRKLEQVWLQRISRSVADDLWILDSELAVLDCSLCAEPSESRARRGRHFLDLLGGDGGQVFRDAVSRAELTPGEPVFVEGLELDGEPSEMDVAWLPDAFYGIRVYAASRPLRPHHAGLMDRLREAYHVDTDADLARAMDVSAGAVAQWRRSGSVPCERLMQCYGDNRVHVHWLLTGRWPMHVD